MMMETKGTRERRCLKGQHGAIVSKSYKEFWPVLRGCSGHIIVSLQIALHLHIAKLFFCKNTSQVKP